jgi:sialidase-1
MRLRARAALAVGTLLAAVVAAPSAAAPAAAADTCTTTLWQAGTGGYAAYRIPAVINAGGTLLAFAEGRRNSSADGGDIEIVQRRSTDGGCTWSAQTVVADAWTDSVDQPVPMVTDAGTVVLMTNWQKGSVSQDDIQAGTSTPQDGPRVFVQTSRRSRGDLVGTAGNHRQRETGRVAVVRHRVPGTASRSSTASPWAAWSSPPTTP